MRKSGLLLVIFVLLLSQMGGLPAYAAIETEGDFEYEANGSGVTITDYSDTAPKEVTIPNELGGEPVTGIGANAFFGKGLTEVLIPKTVMTIGESAFRDNKLTSVEIPAKVTIIEDLSFYNNELTSVVIPNGITIIGEDAFGFNQLPSVKIPASVTTIGKFAFGINELTNVEIPSGVKTIGDTAFYMNKLSSVEFEGTPTTEQSSFMWQEKPPAVFGGWFTDQDFITPWDNSVSKSMTIYAKYTYTLTFEVNGGTSEPAAQSVVENRQATVPTSPTQEGYTFAGWFIDSNLTSEWNFNTGVTADMTLYAKWTPLATSPNIYYVKENGAGSNNGSSWNNAFDSLQSALDLATEGDEIRIAQGTYYPTKEISQGDPRTATFQMKNGVTIYGGFAGIDVNETVEDRDWKANKTILSGDLGTPGVSDDNAYHVFYHPNGTVDNTAVLDGVSIVGGNANGNIATHRYGGGMNNSNSHPTLTNVMLSSNKAVLGGGMSNDDSKPVLTNVTLSGNTSSSSGGGMYNNKGSRPELTNATLSGNTASTGGGMYNQNGSNSVLTNVTLSGNRASNSGGGMYNQNGSHPELTDVTLSGNTASSGGGMLNDTGSNPILTNVTLSGNKATLGGGMSNYNSSPIVSNSIIWGNSSSIDNKNNSRPTFTNSIIEGSSGGQGGNLDVDPRFVDPKGSNEAPTLAGDYRLLPGSPAIPEMMGALGVYEMEIDEVEEMAEVIVQTGTVQADITLPQTVHVTDKTDKTMTLPLGVVWDIAASSFDGNTPGSYSVTGILTLQNYVTNPQNRMAEVTIIVQSKPTHTLSFDVNGGVGTIGNQQVTHGGNVVKPAPPTKSEYTFVGWYEDINTEDEWDFANDSVTQDTTLYAKWTPFTYKDNTDSGVTITGYASAAPKDVVIPAMLGGKPVTVIGKEAFQGKGLTSVTIRASLTSIGDWSFEGNQLSTIDIPASVKSIGNQAFQRNQLLSVDIPDGVKTIGASAFGHNQLSSVKISTSITSLAYAVFTNNQLTNVDIPTSVTSIGGDAFSNNKLIEVTIPNSVTSIGDVAFKGNQLTSVTFNDSILAVSNNSFSNQRQGYIDYLGWFTDKDFTESWNEAVPQEMTIYAKYAYKVSFDTDGGSGIDKQAIALNGVITVPATPRKAGHTFVGWYEDIDLRNAWNFNRGVEADMTLYAKWKKNSSSGGGGGGVIPTYTLTFDSNGGSDVASQKLTYNEAAINPAGPTKEGYTFVGWYAEADLINEWNFGTDIITDMTLYAKWTPNSYTLTFDSNEGSAVDAQSIAYNQIAVSPTLPTKVGYGFAGWYTEKELKTRWNFETDVITKNTTLYAKWAANSHTLTFEPNGGSTVDIQSIVHNEKAMSPIAPTKAGHAFAGWYTEKEFKTKWDFETDVVIKNTTLYAMWTVNNYTLTFDSNGGSAVATQSIVYNETAMKPAVPIKAGYTFVGWFKEVAFTTEWDFVVNKVTENTVLYAKWTPNSSGGEGGSGSSDGGSYYTYTVTFSINEGSPVTSQSLRYNEKVTKPTAPSKVGYTFAGWYKEAAFITEWDFATDVVTEDIVLYAKWTKNPTPIPVQPPKVEQPSEPTCAADFTDTARHWAKKEIDEIACREIIKGYPDGTFRPNESITREHVALMFTRAFELTPTRSSIEFNDVPTSHKYYDAITQVYQAGIFDGAPDGNFNPNTYMTRAQMAKVLVLAFDLQSSETSVNSFRDVPATHWAKDYIATLADNGIALGDDGNFKPEESVTRAQFVAFMYRALNL